MTILDSEQMDFAAEHDLSAGKTARRTATVRNPHGKAVLHIGVKSPAPWLDFYPAEMALAPGGAQTLTAELRPERAGNATLAPVSVPVYAQFLALSGDDADALPPDMELALRVVPPLSSCPHCAADLPDGARECRRCGERIRLCPVCGTPNTWLARACRLNPAHVLRMETDWLHSPGGDGGHALPLSWSVGTRLARRWSVPSFPPARAEATLEWSAPLLAFGMVVASAIDPAAGRASVSAFDITNGAALWEFDLPDPRGIYPDRGAMALSEDGTLYAATLGGSVTAIDAIRGTRRWGATVTGVVYGGVTVAGDALLVPAGETLCVLDRETGSARFVLPLGGRLDTAPAYENGLAVAACDDGSVSAFECATGRALWQTACDGPFDAAPLLHAGTVYAESMAGTVYALFAATGQAKWRTSVTPKGISVAPALSADDLLFVAADDGFVHIVAAETGFLVRSRRVSASPLRTAPVCSGHTVFLGADDGNLYALDADYAVTRAYETTPGARLASAGLALYGDTLACAATNGVLYILRATP